MTKYENYKNMFFRFAKEHGLRKGFNHVDFINGRDMPWSWGYIANRMGTHLVDGTHPSHDWTKKVAAMVCDDLKEYFKSIDKEIEIDCTQQFIDSIKYGNGLIHIVVNNHLCTPMTSIFQLIDYTRNLACHFIKYLKQTQL